jgi:hypothetical protein
MDFTPDTRLSPTSNVHARRFDNEMILLDLNKGLYFGLDEVGAAMWEGFVEGHTMLEVVKSLAGKYQVSEPKLLEDARELARKLTEAGLAVVRTGE